MFLYKTILIFTFCINLLNADKLVCDNNECNHPVTIKSLLHELDSIKEGIVNATKFIEQLNERIDDKLATFTKQIENLTEDLGEQDKPIDDQKEKNNKNTTLSEIDYSLYDNLWILIQRREDGSVDFYRNWTDYKQGFGNQFGEFFVGLEKIYELTNYRDHELLIILEDFISVTKFAHYDHFLIGNETERYRLKKLGKFHGSAGDRLRLHSNMFFSTNDRDNDESDDGNCAEWFKGAWWYYHCMTSNLNGPYRFNRRLKDNERGIGITWGSYDEIQYSYRTAQMMLRAKKKE